MEEFIEKDIADSFMKINLFHHVVDVPNSEIIFSEQLDRVIKSGILDDATYHMCINGDLKNFEKFFDQIAKYTNIKIVHVSDNCKKWEYPTLNYLKSYVDNSADCMYVGYIHMKGSADSSFQNTKDWRRLMEFFIIDNYKKNIEFLDKECNISGINWHNGGINWHFSGNFWWARADYIKTLTPLPDPSTIVMGTKSSITNNYYTAQNFRYDHEAWIGTGKFKYKEMFNSRVHHYLNPYPEHLYINIKIS